MHKQELYCLTEAHRLKEKKHLKLTQFERFLLHTSSITTVHVQYEHYLISMGENEAYNTG